MIINHLGVVPELTFFLLGFASFGLQQTQTTLGSERFTRLDMESVLCRVRGGRQKGRGLPSGVVSRV